MKVSAYEIILPLVGTDEKQIEGYALLVNGLYGALDVVPKEEADKLQTGNLAGLPVALRERLLLRGHITRKDEAGELADLKLLSRIYKTLQGRSGVGLIIMPTYDCNFRCPYCFEQHRLKKGQDWLDNTMNDETMEAVFAALKDYRARGYKLGGCSFYGGEPFLAKNIGVVKKIADKARELGLPMSATTNGYDLEAYLDFIEEYKLTSIQVTVDGTAELNDRRRLHKDGLPTYDRILNNVELALQRGVSVHLRVNVGKENLHGIKDLVDDLKARGFIAKEEERAKEETELRKTDPEAKTKRGEFSYYFKATTDDAHPEKNISEQDTIDEMMHIGFTAEEAVARQSQYNVLWNRMKMLFKKEAYPDFSPAYCGSEMGMLVVDPFGRVFTCWDVVGKDDQVTGYVQPGMSRFLWNFNKAKWRTRTVDLMKACQTCPYALICRGGCASRSNNAYGDYFREFCGEIKGIFAFVASRVAGKEWEKRCADAAAGKAGMDACAGELTLSLAGPVSRFTEAERETVMATTSQKEMFDIVKATAFFPDSEEAGKDNNN
ncbi:MAG: radical SAM protein [Succiniclasticum sp.]